MRGVVVLGLILSVAGVAGAMTPQEAAQHAGHSGYSGREASEIPALTAEQLEALRAGDGMGFALPAELNHYPGPKHALELAAELELTADQRASTEAIFATMQQQAQALGAEIIDAERELNMRFQHGHIDEDTLRTETARIAASYGALRFTHLNAHLATKALLTEQQVTKYDALRGYHHGS